VVHPVVAMVICQRFMKYKAIKNDGIVRNSEVRGLITNNDHTHTHSHTHTHTHTHTMMNLRVIAAAWRYLLT